MGLCLHSVHLRCATVSSLVYPYLAEDNAFVQGPLSWTSKVLPGLGFRLDVRLVEIRASSGRCFQTS